jgi:hypothetical protein
VQAAIGRQHLPGELVAIGGDESLAIPGRNALRKILQRLPEDAPLGILDRERGELRDGPFDDDARLHDSLRGAGAHVVDGLVDPLDETIHAPEEVVVVQGRVERMVAPARSEHCELGVQARKLGHRQQLARVAETLDGNRAAILEGLVSDEIFAREFLRIDRR